MKTIILHDRDATREAIPVRLIPFAAGFEYMAPDRLAQGLAESDLGHRLKGVRAYRLQTDGSHVPMLPKEWEEIAATIIGLGNRLFHKQNVPLEKRAKWKRKSIAELPPGVFVWRDEFVDAFTKLTDELRRDKILCASLQESTQAAESALQKASALSAPQDTLAATHEREGDLDLNFNPYISANYKEVVFEGFAEWLEPQAGTSAALAASGEPDQAEELALREAELPNHSEEADTASPTPPPVPQQAIIDAFVVVKDDSVENEKWWKKRMRSAKRYPWLLNARAWPGQAGRGSKPSYWHPHLI